MPCLDAYGFSIKVALAIDKDFRELKEGLHCTQGCKAQLRAALGGAKEEVMEETNSRA